MSIVEVLAPDRLNYYTDLSYYIRVSRHRPIQIEENSWDDLDETDYAHNLKFGRAGYCKGIQQLQSRNKYDKMEEKDDLDNR